jgi:hypothetical protein
MVMSLRAQVTQTTSVRYHQQSLGQSYTIAVLTQDLTTILCSHAALCMVFASVLLNRLTGSVMTGPLYGSLYVQRKLYSMISHLILHQTIC